MSIGPTKPLIRPWTHRLIDADRRTIDHALVWIANLLPQSLLLHERREANERAQEQQVVSSGRPKLLSRRSIATVHWAVWANRSHRPSHMGRQLLVRRVVVVNCQANLLEIVAATHPPSRFPSRLDGGQQKPHQHADDGDHDKKFHEGETVPKL